MDVMQAAFEEMQKPECERFRKQIAQAQHDDPLFRKEHYYPSPAEREEFFRVRGK